MKSCVVMQWSQCHSLNLIWFTTTLSYNKECLPVAAIQLSINLNHYCSVIYKVTCIIILMIIIKITVLESEVKSELLETITSPFKTLQLFPELEWHLKVHITHCSNLHCVKGTLCYQDLFQIILTSLYLQQTLIAHFVAAWGTIPIPLTSLF